MSKQIRGISVTDELFSRLSACSEEAVTEWADVVERGFQNLINQGLDADFVRKGVIHNYPDEVVT